MMCFDICSTGEMEKERILYYEGKAHLLRFSWSFFLLALILALKNSYRPFCSQPSLNEKPTTNTCNHYSLQFLNKVVVLHPVSTAISADKQLQKTKRYPRLCSNYRGSHFSDFKVYPRLLERRVCLLVGSLIQEGQCGFCPGCGTLDQV